MKSSTKFFISIILLSFLFSGCGTICGGGHYYAHVNVPGHPDAMIYTKHRPQGKGNATFKVKRKDANKFSLSVKEEGCEEQAYNFKKRTFRGWALVGSIVTWTVIAEGIPLPIGMAIDFLNGSFWKPNIFEPGVSKQDYKHYSYILDYKGCKTRDEAPKVIVTPFESIPQKETTKQKVDKLREMKKLLDEGILTQEEFEKEKAKILEEK